MHLVDDHGRAMDAEYHIEADGDHLALVMESRSGMSGARAPRNTDYNRALTILLARLGVLNAVLVDALVDSRHTQDLGLPQADRRLIQAPVQLALEPDADALRRRLGTAQAKIAQAPDATKGGNSTKRIRLHVDVPGFSPGDADRLAQALAAPVVLSAENRAGYWWERVAGESMWMEITRRDDIGADLKAPSAARGGVATGSYVLVPLVQPGDVVVQNDTVRRPSSGSAWPPAPLSQHRFTGWRAEATPGARASSRAGCRVSGSRWTSTSSLNRR